jgi:serine/threonine-protein kinase HipA
VADLDPRQVDAADVWKGQHKAAVLRRTGDGSVELQYNRDYVESGGAAVATSLPATHERLSRPGGSLPPFFTGLLPEGARLNALVSRVRTSADDELSLLLAVGSDTPGDVRVLPAGMDPPAPTAAIQAGSWAEVDLDEVFSLSISSEPGGGDATSLPGVQEKVSDAVISFPVHTAGSQAPAAIVKLSPPAYPRLVENEAFILAMAKGCGLTTVAAEIVHDRNGQPALVVDRYDRVREPGGSVRRLAQEDGCQLLGRYPADKYRLSVREVGAALVQHASAPPVVGLDLLRLLAFSYLVGNSDLHGKNVALLWAADGIASLTPAYDLVTTLPYPLDRSMAMGLDGRRDQWRRRDLHSAGARLGVRTAAVDRMLDRLAQAAEPWLARAEELGFDDTTTVRIAAEWAGRHRRMTASAGL